MSLPVPRLTERPTQGPLVDRFGRAHSYLRLSVTDRCNYRCTYCMPIRGFAWEAREHLLTYAEIVRLVGIFVGMGVRRVRLTGGEPLVRRGLTGLVRQLAEIPGLDELNLTTNGHLLAHHAQELADAGLTRVNVSLDTLDPERFRAITRGGTLERVLEGIEAARAAGLTPVKINVVVVAGENDGEVETMVDWARQHPTTTQLRFIEYMPFDAPLQRHVTEASLRERLRARFDMRPLDARQGGGPATHWQLADGVVVGFISAMSEHFCETCNRLRLQCNGDLRTCLSRDDSPNLRDTLRSGADDDAVEQLIRSMVWGKVAGHEAHLGRAFEGTMTKVGG